jgi:hypothetical protein
MTVFTLEAMAASDSEVYRILHSALGHVKAAQKINNLFDNADEFATSESSVRRYRERFNWESPDPPESGEAPEQDYDELEEKYDDLQRQHNRTLVSLSNAKAKKEELVAAVFDAASQAAAALKLKNVSVPDSKVHYGRGRKSEVAVAVLSDWQLGKVTPTYNSEVCEKRIERFADEVLKITAIQRADHPVNEIHVWCLGDMGEGELIFPGQQWLVDASLYTQVCITGPRILGNFLRKMLANFDKVIVYGVIGNHGRLGGRASREMNAESNGDRMIYRITQQLLAGEDRLSWTIPDGMSERNWYAVDKIGNYSSLLLHGDQFRGQAGMPWYGLQKKIGGWRLGAIPEHFSDVFFGHYHQPTRVTLNSVTARCSGSTESMNTYAMEQLAAVGEPSQPLMFVDPSRGIVTAEYTCWLDKKELNAPR